MEKESEFFSLFDKGSWEKGNFYNVVYKDGLEIAKEKIYEIKESINLNRFSSLFKVIDFFPVDEDRIYYVDNNNKLWEFNSYDDTFKELFYIETNGTILHFKIVDQNVFTLMRYEGNYYVKTFMLQTGQIINKRSLRDSIQGVTMNNYGDVYAIENGRMIYFHRNGGEEEDIRGKFNNEFTNILDSNNKDKKFIVEVYKNILIAIYDIEDEIVYIIKVKNKIPMVISRIKMKKIKCMSFNEKKEIIVNSEILGECKLTIIKPPKYSVKYVMPKFTGEVESIRRQSNGDIHLKSKYNIQYILGRTDAVSMKYDNNTYKGVYYSKVFDSMEQEMKWHKFMIDGNIPDDTQIKIKFYIFDKLNVYYKNRWSTIQDILDDEKISFIEKEKYFDNLWTGEINNPTEALIQKGRGRYLFFKLELLGRKNRTPNIRKIKVFFNRISYLRYLPEIYQGNLKDNDFIERFMSIFESFYMNIEDKIDYISNYFDIEIAPLNFLQWICQWIGMDQYVNWEEDKLRKLLSESASLHRERGTRNTIERILEIYLGDRPLIVENFELNEVKKDKRLRGLVKQLYGNNPYNFTVLIQDGDLITDEVYDGIKNILLNEAPAHCEFNVILLRSWIFLDNYSYLGINSTVYDYTQLKLDGKGVMPYNSLLLDTVRERVMSGVTRIEVNTKLN